MSDKYIIKNCPNYRDREVDYTCTVEAICSDCQDCTNCVMKQIVELCKYWETYESCYDCAWGGTFGRKILQLLDIQEIE